MNRNTVTGVVAAAAFIGLSGSAFSQAGGGMGAAGTGMGAGMGMRAGMGKMRNRMGKSHHSMMKGHRMTKKQPKPKKNSVGMKGKIGKNTGNGPGFSGAAGTGAPGVTRNMQNGQ